MNHFPQIRFDGWVKKLFNPITKRRYEPRPEERVRLSLLEKLIYEEGWSRNRIGFEVPLNTSHSDHTVRADLILYDDAMRPFVLIECKSPSVGLNLAVGEQVARYNRTLKAPWLMLTNGRQEQWFRIEEGKAEPVSAPVLARMRGENAGYAGDDGGRSSYADADASVGAGRGEDAGAGQDLDAEGVVNSTPGEFRETLKNPLYWQERGFLAGQTIQGADDLQLLHLTRLLISEFSRSGGAGLMAEDDVAEEDEFRVEPSESVEGVKGLKDGFDESDVKGLKGVSDVKGLKDGFDESDVKGLKDGFDVKDTRNVRVQFVTPKTPFSNYKPDHYYQIITQPDGGATAWTILSTPQDGTRFIALFTNLGRPAGAVDIALDTLIRQKNPSEPTAPVPSTPSPKASKTMPLHTKASSTKVSEPMPPPNTASSTTASSTKASARVFTYKKGQPKQIEPPKKLAEILCSSNGMIVFDADALQRFYTFFTSK